MFQAFLENTSKKQTREKTMVEPKKDQEQKEQLHDIPSDQTFSNKSSSLENSDPLKTSTVKDVAMKQEMMNQTDRKTW